MSYTKQTWSDGDMITANKLNHMESGIENAGGIVVCSLEGSGQRHLSITFGQIQEAVQANKLVMLYVNVNGEYNCCTLGTFGPGYNDPEKYYVYFPGLSFNFLEGDLDDYPLEDMD